jgi:hypothetical protein
MKTRLFILLCALCDSDQILLSQTVNTNFLRQDETLQYDEIALRFSTVCHPLPDPRTLGLGVDKVQFLDASSNSLFTIDVGTAAGSYYLGEGWYYAEAWAAGLTMCWANALATQSVFYCHVPSGSRFLNFLCTSACTSLTTEVLLNGQMLGSFSLPANSGWKPCRLVLPNPVPRYLDYTLISGGPLAITAIDWIDAEGQVASTLPTPCSLSTPGAMSSFPAMIPEGVGDFRVRLANPAGTLAKLRVSVNNSSSLVVGIGAGSNEVWSLETDALERQADRHTKNDGWREDFNARKPGRVWTWPNSRYPPVACDGDALKIPFVEGESSVQLSVSLAEPLRISEFPYLSVKLRASKGAIYFVRPEGYDDVGNHTLLWFEEAPTDDRVGTGEWETLTVSLPKLVKMAGTAATKVSMIHFPLVTGSATNATLELDWVSVHRGFLPNPEDRTLTETTFSNYLDDDGDGLTDKDDSLDYQRHNFGTPLVLCHYHPWFGSRLGPSGAWLGWKAQKMDFSDPNNPPTPLGITYDPDTMDPQFPGKRNTCSIYYPLNFRDYPEYTPPTNGEYRYDLYGGLEQYDNLSTTYGRNEIALAQKYGIDGFLADSGGQGSLELQIENTLTCSTLAQSPFWLTVDYDWYYRLPAFNLMTEKPDYGMALDLMFFFQHYGGHPSWLRYDSRPVIMAAFLSFTIPVEKWKRVEQICLDPSSSPFDGTLASGSRRPGYGNSLVFSFARAGRPPSDGRYLSVVFDYIQLYDCNLSPMTKFDFGTPAMRTHLLSGWSGDETWADGNTWVWAAGTQRVATAEIELSTEARFMEIRCYSYPSNNTATMTINGGSPFTFAVSQPARSYFFRLTEIGLTACPQRTSRPFALFLDSQEAAACFDGFAAYGSYLRSRYCIVSDPLPTILTVGCGYDDRKIRYPVNSTDRENGALYRRQWESALAGAPDIVLVNTWNEWAEGTIIQPSVEFGYKYLELTLTYSLIFHGKMLTSVKPSAMELTIKKYEVNLDGQSEIRLSATNQGTVVFTNLPCDHLVSFQAIRDGLPFDGFTLNPTNATLMLNLLNTAAEYCVSLVRDAVPPVGSVWINGGAAYTDSTNVLLSLVASDNRGTVAGARYSNDGSNWTGWEGYTTNKSWSPTPGDGPKTVFVQFKDDIGNIATCSAKITVGRCWFESINRRSNGVVDLKFTGTVGGRYRFEAATNLGAWFPLMMVTNTSRTITSADQSATNSQRRFYRAMQQ